MDAAKIVSVLLLYHAFPFRLLLLLFVVILLPLKPGISLGFLLNDQPQESFCNGMELSSINNKTPMTYDGK